MVNVVNKLRKPYQLIVRYSRSITILFFFTLLILFVVGFERFDVTSLEHQKKVGEALQPFAISLGAILSGTAGLAYIESWVSKQKTKSILAIDWRKRFPVDQLNFKYTLVESKELKGILYVYDMENNRKHWIVNPHTLRALGLSYADVKTLSDQQFSKIPRGDNIQL